MAQDSTVNENRQSTRLWLNAAIIAWEASFVIMAAFATYVVIRGQQVNSSLCKVTDDNRDLQRKIINTQKQQALNSVTDIYQRNLVRQNYNELLALIPPLKCSTSGGPQELEP